MGFLTDLTSRFRSFLHRDREERELREELETHLAMEQAHRSSQGLSAEEAARQSRIALGGIDQTTEQMRDALGTRLLEDLKQDFHYAARTLRRSWGFALVVTLTLALGIGGTTAVFSAVNAVLLRPLPYEQPGQLVRIYQPYQKKLTGHDFLTPVHFVELRNQASSFESMAAIYTYNESGGDIGSGDEVRRIRSLPVSAGYFDVVRVKPEIGQDFTRADEQGTRSIILSHRLWQDQLGGSPGVIGDALTMDGRPYTIVGVMPDRFEDPIAGPIDAWIPLDLSPASEPNNAQNHYLTATARLRPGVTLEQAQAEMNAVARSVEQRYPRAKDARLRLYPLKEDIVGPSSRALTLMLGGVGLVLLLVCVNIANLLLVRASERAREFALRSALGAGRTRLGRQLLIESLTLALIGAVAGLGVARLGMLAIARLGAGTIPRLDTMTLDPVVLGFSFGIGVFSAVLFGLAPARSAARTQPGDVLRDQSRSATSGVASMRLRETLVVSQVALAFVLMFGAGLLLASFHQLGQVDLGIKPQKVLTYELNLPSARYDSTARGRLYEDLATRTKALPGVVAAGGVSRLPVTGSYHSWGLEVASGPYANTPEGRREANNRVVSGEYFKAAGIPIVAGRAFDERDDAGAPPRVIVSQNLATRFFPGMDPIGQVVRVGTDNEIIGVAGDVALSNENDGAFYVYHAHRQFAGDRNWSLTQVISATGDPMALVPQIRRVLADLDPGLVLYRPIPLDDVIGRGVAQRLFTLRLLLTFAAVALGLSALGLFGVLSYSVRLRAREFGIRLALGAERGSIRGLVLGRGLRLTLIGIMAGGAGALALGRLMASLVFRVQPLDPTVLVGAALFMLLVGGIAAYLPAHQATRADPRETLQ